MENVTTFGYCVGHPAAICGASAIKGGNEYEQSKGPIFRYMVNELDPAVNFYTTHLGFRVERESKPNFAMLERGNLELVLSTPFGPGGAAKPMSDGRKAEPAGWHHIINVNDLQTEVARLKEAHLHFRNDIVSGPGGSEILLDDPSGNPVELFQPAQ